MEVYRDGLKFFVVIKLGVFYRRILSDYIFSNFDRS